MIATPFYHKTVAKTLIAFGTLFSNIFIERETQDGTRSQRIPVPLTYGPKEKVLELVRANPDISRTVSNILPRIAFEMTSLQYDPQRKVGKTQFISTDGATPEERKKLWAPVPYTMVLDMDIITKYQEDGLQIIEQIVPYFQPDMTVSIFDVPGKSMSRDVPIVLSAVNVADEYESGVDTKRLVTWSLSFEAKINLYRPINDGKVIKKVEVTLNDDMTLDQWVTKYNAAVNPLAANKDDPHTIDETWEE